MLSINGILELTAPVTHGALDPDIDRKKTNVVEFRKMPVYNPEIGVFLQLPVISGNSIKGSTRRIFMQNICAILGIFPEDDMPVDVQHLLFAGGTTSNAKPKPANQKEYTELRNRLPFLDLLGGSYKGHFFKSLIKVGIAIPIVQELMHLCQEEIAAVYGSSNIVFPTVQDLEAEIAQNPIGYTKMALESKSELDEGEKGQMIYFAEAMPAGVRLMHSFGLSKGAGSLTESAFYSFVRTFINEVNLGGQGGKGHGNFRAKYVLDGKELTDKELEEKEKPFLNYLKDNKGAIVEKLKSIPDILQAKTDKKG